MENIGNGIEKLKTEFIASPMGLPTGFRLLNQAIHGLLPKQLMIIGGYPSSGKTSLLSDLALAIGKENKVSIFSLEMGKLRIQARLACSLAGVSFARARDGKLNKVETDKFDKAIEELKSYKINIDDSVKIIGNDPYWLNAKKLPIERTMDYVISQEVKKGSKAILIDYLQLILPLRPTVDKLIYGEIVLALYEYAKKYDISIVLFTQLRKADQARHGKEEVNPKPNLDDIMGSSEIRAHADIILLLHRPQQGKGEIALFSNCIEDDALFLLLKNRDGACGEIPVNFHAYDMKWCDKDVVGETI